MPSPAEPPNTPSHYWFRNNLCILRQIWPKISKYPPEQPRPHTLIEKVFLSLPLIIAVISLSNFKHRAKTKQAEQTFMDLYVGLSAILTTLALVEFSLAPCLCAVFAAYRIVDSTNYRVYFLFIGSQRERWKPISLRRSLVIAVFNLYESIVAFAILYLFSNGVVENTPGGAVLTSRFTAFYYSFVTMLTVGYGDYVPKTLGAQVIAVAQLSAVLVFLIFIVPALISVMSSELAEDRTGQSARAQTPPPTVAAAGGDAAPPQPGS